MLSIRKLSVPVLGLVLTLNAFALVEVREGFKPEGLKAIEGKVGLVENSKASKAIEGIIGVKGVSDPTMMTREQVSALSKNADALALAEKERPGFSDVVKAADALWRTQALIDRTASTAKLNTAYAAGKAGEAKNHQTTKGGISAKDLARPGAAEAPAGSVSLVELEGIVPELAGKTSSIEGLKGVQSVEPSVVQGLLALKAQAAAEGHSLSQAEVAGFLVDAAKDPSGGSYLMTLQRLKAQAFSDMKKELDAVDARGTNAAKAEGYGTLIDGIEASAKSKAEADKTALLAEIESLKGQRTGKSGAALTELNATIDALTADHANWDANIAANMKHLRDLQGRLASGDASVHGELRNLVEAYKLGEKRDPNMPESKFCRIGASTCPC